MPVPDPLTARTYPGVALDPGIVRFDVKRLAARAVPTTFIVATFAVVE
jgi:hypothetical protein